jgi:hypothetical protein
MNALAGLFEGLALFDADGRATVIRGDDTLSPIDKVASYVRECIQGTSSNSFHTVDIRTSGGSPSLNRDLGEYMISKGFVSFSAKTMGTSWLTHESSIFPPTLLVEIGGIARRHNARVTVIRFLSEWKDQGDFNFIPIDDDN